MRYKGKTIQFQRVRAKKAPKIEQVSSDILTEEERKRLEQRGLEEAKKGTKRIEEIVEQTPDWQLYCVIKQEQQQVEDQFAKFETAEFWQNLVQQMIQKSEEIGVGDTQDRINTLAEKFKLPTE